VSPSRRRQRRRPSSSPSPGEAGVDDEDSLTHAVSGVPTGDAVSEVVLPGLRLEGHDWEVRVELAEVGGIPGDDGVMALARVEDDAGVDGVVRAALATRTSAFNHG
jgi:hypothetical protein